MAAKFDVSVGFVIRKEKGRPVGRDHINGIEGFCSYAQYWPYLYLDPI